MKKLHYIALFHPINEELKARLDFNTELSPTSILNVLWIEGYKLYQFILNDSQYILPIEKLTEMNAKFATFEIEKSTWFGLCSETQHELLILPESGFYYPYSFGSYFYLFSKEDISGEEFINWLNIYFPNRFADFDESGSNSDTIKLLHDSDYFLITNYDVQNEFGITAQKETCEILIKKLEQVNLENFEIEEYIQPR